MGRDRTGSLERVGAALYARITLDNGRRVRVRLPDGTTEADAAVIVRKVADAAARERFEVAPAKPRVTLWSAWAETWFRGRKARGMTSVPSDRSRWETWCKPLHGLSVREVTAEHVEALVMRLDAAIADGKLTWKSAGNVWGMVRAMLRDMSRSKDQSLRVRKVDPSAGVAGPDGGEDAARVYLYPNEALRLLACRDVPVRLRALYAITMYTYTRAGELATLRAGDFDLAAGVVRVSRARDKMLGGEKATKGGTARMLPIEPSILPLLEVVLGDPRALVCHLETKGMGGPLRDHLRAAGVDRPALFAEGPSERPLTFHDLRATGITWLALRGDDPLKIQRRAGHSRFETTQRYIREAEVLGPGVGTPFPALPQSLLDESSKESAKDAKPLKNGRRIGVNMWASHLGKSTKTSGCETPLDDIDAEERNGVEFAAVAGRLRGALGGQVTAWADLDRWQYHAEAEQ